MRRLNAAGLFEATVPAGEPGYRIRFRNDEREWEQEDPYRFSPTLGELDLHLIGEGTHTQLWRVLGARVIEHQGVTGTAFSVWAPNALGVSVVSDANFWDARTWPMRMLGRFGRLGALLPRASGRACATSSWSRAATGCASSRPIPLARASDHPPGTASIVEQSEHRWRDGAVDAPARARHRCTARRSPSTRSISAPGGAVPTAACSTTGRSPSRSRRIAAPWASPTSSCCRSWSIPSAVPGATRSPGTTRRPRGTALPTTSAISSTSCTAAASA